MLHTPSLCLLDVHPTLLAGICCIGACYANYLAADTVRRATDILRVAAAACSSFLLSDRDQHHHHHHHQTPFGHDAEELQAFTIIVLHLLCTPSQRSQARHMWPALARQASQIGLFDVATDALVALSPLHQANLDPGLVSASTFDWTGWVQQEERSRLAHVMLVVDSAMVLYLNLPSHIDCFKVRAPLPADDAAWDAGSAETCAEALGLLGAHAHAARTENTGDVARPTQPCGDGVLQALLQPSHDIMPDQTNSRGRFIILSIHSMVCRQDSLPQPTLHQLESALDKFQSNLDHIGRIGSWRDDDVHLYWLLAKVLLKNTRPAHLCLTPDQHLVQIMQILQLVRHWFVSGAATRGEELDLADDGDASYETHNLTLTFSDVFKPVGENDELAVTIQTDPATFYDAGEL